MNFDLDADDRALQEAIRDLCRGRFPMERVREAGLDRDAWRALGDAGVFSLRLAEASGGAGLGMSRAVIVYEDLGASLVPGPLVASNLAAALSPGIAKGERIAGIVDRAQGPHLVEHLAELDDLYVLEDDGIARVDATTLDAEPVESPLDPLTPLCRLQEMPAGEPAGDRADARRWRREGAVLTAALALGIAGATTRAATEYAKQRVQFGRPIGSFQAVKHILADMLVRTEVARAAVYAAGCVLDHSSSGDVRTAVAAAKLLADEAAIANGKASIQVHGGMGFTWEVDAHLYVKRAAVLATQFGTSEEHAVLAAASLA